MLVCLDAVITNMLITDHCVCCCRNRKSFTKIHIFFILSCPVFLCILFFFSCICLQSYFLSPIVFCLARATVLSVVLFLTCFQTHLQYCLIVFKRYCKGCDRSVKLSRNESECISHSCITVLVLNQISIAVCSPEKGLDSVPNPEAYS